LWGSMGENHPGSHRGGSGKSPRGSVGGDLACEKKPVNGGGGPGGGRCCCLSVGERGHPAFWGGGADGEPVGPPQTPGLGKTTFNQGRSLSGVWGNSLVRHLSGRLSGATARQAGGGVLWVFGDVPWDRELPPHLSGAQGAAGGGRKKQKNKRPWCGTKSKSAKIKKKRLATHPPGQLNGAHPDKQGTGRNRFFFR